MEENVRRVAQVIGSKAREAVRGEESHMLHEHQVLLQAGVREKEFVKSQALGATVTHDKFWKTLTRSGSSTRANYTTLGISGNATEIPVAN